MNTVTVVNIMKNDAQIKSSIFSQLEFPYQYINVYCNQRFNFP